MCFIEVSGAIVFVHLLEFLYVTTCCIFREFKKSEFVIWIAEKLFIDNNERNILENLRPSPIVGYSLLLSLDMLCILSLNRFGLSRWSKISIFVPYIIREIYCSYLLGIISLNIAPFLI